MQAVTPDRFEKRLAWLKPLKDHLNTRVIPVAASHSVDLSAQSLQDSVLVNLAGSRAPLERKGTPISQPEDVTRCSSRTNPHVLPLDSEIVTVERLLIYQRSFRACFWEQAAQFCNGQSEDIQGDLVEHPVVLVALLTSSHSCKDTSLMIKDITGEIPCETLLPAQTKLNSIVLLKEWNLICSSSYENYLEIEELVNVGQLVTRPSLLLERESYLSVADVQPHIKSGGPKPLKILVNIIGRLCAISEPFKNGPEFMLILCLTHTADSSITCQLITQSPELIHWSRVLKLFTVYAFTNLKTVVMNKGKEDEMMVLTTTPHSAVDSVSIDEVPPVMSSLGRASPNQRQEGEEEEEAVVSLLRKKSRTEVDGDNQASCALEAFSRKCAIQPPVNPVSQNTALLSYKGVITDYLLPEAGVYELDDRLALYLTHSNLSNQGRGLRKGAEVEISNAHVLKISSPLYKKLSGFVCCSVSRIEVVRFSKKDTKFKAFIPQNKLGHMLSKFRAMDVAWLTLAFLSLMKKLKKKREAYSVLTQLCTMTGITRTQQDTHSSFLQVPHFCQFLEPANLSQRPLLPSLSHVIQYCRELASSVSFCWRGSSRERGGVASSSASLSVAVSATWSFGIVRSTDFPNPQLLIGTLCGNRLSGRLELSDSTASIPLVKTDEGSDTSIPWLLGFRDGSRVAIGEFRVIIERIMESERAKLSFYIDTNDLKVLADEKSQGQGEMCDEKKNLSASSPSVLYVYVKSKNCLKSQGPAKCGFDAQALAHTNLEVLHDAHVHSSTAQDGGLFPAAIGFTSARWYAYIHNGCIYRLTSLESSHHKLPSLETLRQEPYIAVHDGVLLEMVALPREPEQRVLHSSDCLLEVGELVSKFYLPKLKTAFATDSNDPSPRCNGGLVSFRGVITEHSYRIDCDTTHLITFTSAAQTSNSHALRQIIALNVRGICCPNTIMIYCSYKSHEPLPLGLLPGAVATFHFFSLKCSTRSGNMYCVNCPTSSISVRSIPTEAVSVSLPANPRNKFCGVTQEMLSLPISHLYDLTQQMVRGRLSRQIVCLRSTIMAVQHAFIQFQCQACQCTAIDGRCRPTCPLKKATLNTDARFLIQDGTGEAHLYVNDRVLPIALGMTDREWSDLLDLIYKVGQVTYTKSSLHKGKRPSRAVTIQEKAEQMFLDAVTRPSLIRTTTIYCQPFLSSSELKVVLGQKSHRVWLRHSTEYETLSLPRLQLRALALAPTEPLTLSHKLLSLLEPSPS